MSFTKSIILETVSFAANLLHREEIFNYSLENIYNFTNPLASNIESGNDTFSFKEVTS